MTIIEFIQLFSAILGIGTAIYLLNKWFKKTTECSVVYLWIIFIINVVACLVIYFSYKYRLYDGLDENKIVLILLFCGFILTLLLILVMIKMKNSYKKNLNTNYIPCSFWSDYIKQEEPNICFNSEMVAGISGSRAYRFLIHIFKHQKSDQFFALDLAFSRWFEINDDESVVNISESILNAIGEMCRQKNCMEFKRILCITEFHLFQKTEMTINVLKKIREKEKEWTKNYNVSLETYVCIFSGSENHERKGMTFASSKVAEIVADINDFALFIGDVNIGISEPSLTDPNVYIPLEKSNFEIIKNKSRIDKMKKGFKLILGESHPVDTVISTIQQGG